MDETNDQECNDAGDVSMAQVVPGLLKGQGSNKARAPIRPGLP